MLRTPLTVDINLTNRCNYDCSFCSATPFHHSSRRDELTLDEVVSIFDQLDRMGVFLVRLAGGEPFARRDILGIIEACSNRVFESLILTNGSLLNERAAGAMVAAGMKSVAISVDGPDPALHDRMRGREGSYATLLSKLPILRAAGLSYGAMTTVTGANCSRLVEIVKSLDGLGFDSVNFILLNFSGRARDKAMFSTWSQWSEAFVALSEFISAERPDIKVSVLPPHEDAQPYELWAPLKAAGRLNLLEEVWNVPAHVSVDGPIALGCAAGKTQMTIFENGDVFGCELMRDFSGFNAGNVRTRSLQAIWDESPVFNQLRGLHKSDLVGHCQGCPLPCGGGCRASAANMTGSMTGSDENCHMSRG